MFTLDSLTKRFLGVTQYMKRVIYCQIRSWVVSVAARSGRMRVALPRDLGIRGRKWRGEYGIFVCAPEVTLGAAEILNKIRVNTI